MQTVMKILINFACMWLWPVLAVVTPPKVDQSHQRFHGSTGGVLVEGSIDLIQVDVAKSLWLSESAVIYGTHVVVL